MDADWLRSIERFVVPRDRIVRTSPLTGGEVNETVRVACASGAEYVIRRAPEGLPDWHPSVEGQVAAMDMARRAGIPVPEVTYAEGRVLAYRYVDGEAIRPERCSPTLAREVGRLHGLLHERRGDGLGPVQGDGHSPKWSDDVVFRDVGGWTERLLALADPAPLPKSDVEAAAELLLSHQPTPRSRLVHGDASPGNTIVAGGRVAALIDFDDAWFGDPAGDIAWWWWYAPATAEDFAAGCAESSEPTAVSTLWLYRLRLLLGLADTFAPGNAAKAERISQLLPTTLGNTRRAVRNA